MSEELYYITRGALGNCLTLWKHTNYGYAADIDEARIFTKPEANEIIDRDYGSKYIAWPKEYIDKHIHRHIDTKFIESEYGITRKSKEKEDDREASKRI